jgi:phospholipid/cholesterol/gamma-HCH transport system permease protein
MSPARALASIVLPWGDYAWLMLQTARWTFRRPFDSHELARQMVRVGVESIPVVFFTALFSGMVLALQTYAGFARFRAEAFTGGVVALSVMREVAPVFTALMVTGRVGSSMAAELGSMRATEQIDALSAMAVEPIQYLFVPRILAGVAMLPLLQVIADAVAIGGGRVVATTLMGANSEQYDWSTFYLLDLPDFTGGLIKAAVFAFFLTSIACVKGFLAVGGAEGVGKASTQAVVTTSVAIVISDFFLTKMIF